MSETKLPHFLTSHRKRPTRLDLLLRSTTCTATVRPQLAKSPSTKSDLEHHWVDKSTWQLVTTTVQLAAPIVEVQWTPPWMQPTAIWRQLLFDQQTKSHVPIGRNWQGCTAGDVLLLTVLDSQLPAVASTAILVYWRLTHATTCTATVRPQPKCSRCSSHVLRCDWLIDYCNDMDMGRVIAIQPIYANPTQPNP